MLTIHIADPDSLSDEEWASALRELEWIRGEEKKANAKRNLEYFESLGLPTRLLLEAHDLFSSGKRICELFESTGRTLPVIWDTYHTYFTGKESLSESWELLESYIIDVHIKDGNGKELCLPGEGIFPTTELFALLKEKNYAGLITSKFHFRYNAKHR